MRRLHRKVNVLRAFGSRSFTIFLQNCDFSLCRFTSFSLEVLPQTPFLSFLSNIFNLYYNNVYIETLKTHYSHIQQMIINWTYLDRYTIWSIIRIKCITSTKVFTNNQDITSIFADIFQKLCFLQLEVADCNLFINICLLKIS